MSCSASRVTSTRSYLQQSKTTSTSAVYFTHSTDMLTAVLWHRWLGVRKNIRTIKNASNEVLAAGMVICLKQGANDLHMGSADATATPSSLAPGKGRMVYLSGASLLRLSWKRGHKTGVFLHADVIGDITAKAGSSYLPSLLWHCWLGDSNGIQPVRNLCHSSPKVLFWNKWRKKTKQDPANQFHMENNH